MVRFSLIGLFEYMRHLFWIIDQSDYNIIYIQRLIKMKIQSELKKKKNWSHMYNYNAITKRAKTHFAFKSICI